MGFGCSAPQFLLQTTERYFKDTDVRLYYDIDYQRFELRFVNDEPCGFGAMVRTSESSSAAMKSEETARCTLYATFDVIARVVELRRR